MSATSATVIEIMGTTKPDLITRGPRPYASPDPQTLRALLHPYITAIQFGFLTPSSTGGEVGELVCSTHWLKYGGVAVTVAVTGRYGDIISQGIGAAWNRDQCMSVLRMDWEMSVIRRA